MLSGLSEHGIVVLVLPGHHRVLRVVRLGGRQQRLDTEQDSPQGHGGGPLVLQYVQADGARHAGDVGVPDLGDEPHLGRVERVRAGDLDLQVERPAFVGRVGWAGDRSGQLCNK